jgi:Tol biopolymer transport system component
MNPTMRILLMFTLVFILTGCRSVWREPVPGGEILYQKDSIYKSYLLGFVQANGENNEILDLNRPFNKVVWSEDGKILYGLADGKTYDYGYPAFWDLDKGRLKICKRNLPYYTQIQGAGNKDNPYDVYIMHTTELISMDLSTCKHLQTILNYSNKKDRTEIIGFSYSSSRHSLVYGLRILDRETRNVDFQLIYLNLTTGESTRVGDGIWPSWSPDGSQIAYIGLDGLYILSVENVGAEPMQISTQPFFNHGSYHFNSTITWSPDGKWLAYHRCEIGRYCIPEEAQIYKIPSVGGQEEIILDGGKYPAWRP